MRDTEPSRTAAYVAVSRGLGALLPPEAQLADDPYGVAFATHAPMAKWFTELRASNSLYARYLANVPGVRDWLLYMQVRTRILDDVVRTFVAAGGAQVVLLGAGYDCRALRLPELAAARVFEVDHPATQARKQFVLAKLHALSHATYLSWDFESRPMSELPTALAAMGHDPLAPTLTIWEGVTMYLTEPAIDASVRAIGDYSCVGSRLAMSYFTRARISKPSLSMRGIMRVLRSGGEPWRWGWEPAELPAWMAARGFVVADDVGMSDAALKLLPRKFATADNMRRIAQVEPERIATSGRV